MHARHIPVLPAEVVELLAPASGQIFVDATIGVGGHSRLLAERLGPTGLLIGIDRDAAMLDIARQGLPSTRLFHAEFDQLAEVLQSAGISAIDGILADL